MAEVEVKMTAADLAKFEKMKIKEDNKALYNKEYYEANKERLNAANKKRMEAPEAKAKKAARDKKYREQDGQKAKDAAAKKANYDLNKEAINEKRRTETFECECGLTVKCAGKAKHCKTKVHLELMSKKNI